MKATLRFCSQFRKPSIHFIGKRQIPSTRDIPHPHPAAPPEYQRVFTAQDASTQSTPSTPVSKEGTTAAAYVHFWEAPSHIWRPRVSQLSDKEMDSIMSGGATW
ncbi:hypothetical protein FA15DRAFT_622841 [Coprinopsis marcescibilis]|uniref:Uncharacterized protein n=1 Tax=Coprinopsis marcescibilis TaxID=230819 RepID=A0A5C3KPG2_COPMA|nr:hypothetical protein FA15DRAFT_622841 [Coprinopsis marcescibilis]